MRVSAFLLGAAALALGACGVAGGGSPANVMDPEVKPNFVEVAISPRCAMPRAGGSDHIGYVYTYGGGHKTPMAHAFKATGQGGEAYHKRIDLVVTRTDKPVYLLLDSYNALMWNIVAAPGAQISGVGVMSYEGSSVLGVPEGVDVGFLAFRGVSNKGCFNRDRGSALTARERAEKAFEFNGYEATSNDMRNWAQDYKNGNIWRNQWVPRTFGGTIDEYFSPRSDDGYVVYVGPKPDQPFEMPPILTVHVPDTVHPAWGTRDEVLAEFDAIARKELEALMN